MDCVADLELERDGGLSQPVRKFGSERPIVLVVDDDPWIRLLMRDLLTDEGYAVLEASNGFAALRLVERQAPTIVLLDLLWPEQSGLDLLTFLQPTRTPTHLPSLPEPPPP